MNYRLNKLALYAVLLLVLVAIAIFGYTLIGAPTDEDRNDDVTQVPGQVEVNGRSIQAKHQFKQGTHTIAGTVDMPTPCHRLIAEPFFTDESRQEVELRFTTSVEGDVCAQVITPTRFKVDFEAPEQARITGTWNGGTAGLNLVPVAPGEDLADFDVFVKG